MLTRPLYNVIKCDGKCFFEDKFKVENLFICERITVCSASCDSDVTDNFYIMSNANVTEKMMKRSFQNFFRN